MYIKPVSCGGISLRFHILIIFPYGGLILKLCLVVTSVLDFIFNHFPMWWSYIKIVSCGGISL